MAWEVPATNLSVDQARSILDANGIDGVDAKIQERTSASGSVLLIQVGDQSVEKRQQVKKRSATAAEGRHRIGQRQLGQFHLGAQHHREGRPRPRSSS